MESLSWFFFCLAPFALFCSESGAGFILCPACIILGFIFKYAKIGEKPKLVVKVAQHEFWEWHYNNRIANDIANKDSIGDRMMAIKDIEARNWATTICPLGLFIAMLPKAHLTSHSRMSGSRFLPQRELNWCGSGLLSEDVE